MSDILNAKRMRPSSTLVAGSALLLGLACDTAPTVAPQPPTGGQDFVLSYSDFVDDIAPLLTAHGCDNLSCHGGGFRGTFMLSPVDDKDIDVDFEQVSLQVNGYDPVASSILMKPLDPNAGGAVHAADPGQYGFLSTSDPDYQTILLWIQDGEFR